MRTSACSAYRSDTQDGESGCFSHPPLISLVVSICGIPLCLEMEGLFGIHCEYPNDSYFSDQRGMLSKRTRTCGHCNGNRSPEHFSTIVRLVQEPGLRDGGKSPVSLLWLPQRGDRCKTTADDQDYFVRVSNILKPVCIAENRRCSLLTCRTKWRGGGDPASRNTLLLAGIHVCMIRCMPTCSTCPSSDLDLSKCAYSFFGILTKMIV